MYLFQFLADPLGPSPVVFEVTSLNTSLSSSARALYQDVSYLPGKWDAMGSDQALFEAGEMTASGMAMCRQGRLREPAHRAMGRLLGRRGWIIAYRYENCACPSCTGSCTCGYGIRTRAPVTWYATTGRLIKADAATTLGDGAEYGFAPLTPQLSFMIDHPWEYINGRHWEFGDLKITVNPNLSQLGISGIGDLITERHQPCSIGAQGVSHGCWWRLPHAQLERYPFIEENCVGNWSSGGWQAAYLADRVLNHDGTVRYEKAVEPTSVFVPGDWPPDARIAITNFAYLEAKFKHGGVQHASLVLKHKVSNPQYLYIDTLTGETSVRYCPLSTSPCIDLRELATFVPEAGMASPALVEFAIGNSLSLLKPGWNQIEFTGFHLSNNPFAWSYDLVPRWS